MRHCMWNQNQNQTQPQAQDQDDDQDQAGPSRPAGAAGNTAPSGQLRK